AAKKDNFLDFAVLLPRLRRARDRDGKFVHQYPRRSRQFFLLDRRKMIHIVSHHRFLAVFMSGGKALLQQMRVGVPRSDT
ncbi:MAG: hypothetical protein ABIH17_11625, partial [Pseudomonadota bacterium]